MHEHKEQGQTLRHDHPGGELPHGYFEHPEDGSHATVSGTPVADALAVVDRKQNTNGQNGELTALRNLAEAVRASLTAFSELDVRALAVTANDLGGGATYLPREQRAVLDKAQALFGLVAGLPDRHTS